MSPRAHTWKACPKVNYSFAVASWATVALQCPPGHIVHGTPGQKSKLKSTALLIARKAVSECPCFIYVHFHSQSVYTISQIFAVADSISVEDFESGVPGILQLGQHTCLPPPGHRR